MKYTSLLCVLAVGIMFVGCTAPKTESLSAAEKARIAYEKAPEKEKARAAVEQGCHLLKSGEVDEAQRYFIIATDIIEAVYAQDKHAEKAMSLWHGESEKIFRGEPYERSLTYLYLGITYLLQNDFENARACFRRSSIQDAFAADDQHISDFLAAEYLEAYCEYLLGDIKAANVLLNKVQSHQPALGSVQDSHNLMMMCETGSTPMKIATGDYGEKLEFLESPDDVWAIEMLVGNEKRYVYDTANTFYQAVTRGGRFVDHVLKKKAKYKKTAKISADVLWTAGTICLVAAMHTDDDAQMYLLMAAGTCYAVGGVVHIVGECINPNADTRMIATFPGRLYFQSCAIPEQADHLELRYYGRYMDEIRPAIQIPLPNEFDKKLLCAVAPNRITTNWETAK